MSKTAEHKILTLVNPISGRGQGRILAKRLGPLFERNGLETDIVLLPGPGQARDILARAETTYAAVVAVGGDGTLNEVAEACYREGRHKVIGLIPLGLSNCLARHYGLPFNAEHAVEVIAAGRKSPLDLAVINNSRVAHSFVGVGFDAAVVHKVGVQRRGPVSNRAYARAAFQVFREKDWSELRVSVDGNPVQGPYFQAILCSVANYAHFFSVSAVNGFVLLLFRDGGAWGLMRVLLKMGIKRDLARACDLVVPVASTVTITSLGSADWYQIDGEVGGRLPLNCTIQSGALEIIRP
jgi:diacylglycerol kinase family enzyme